MSEVQIIILAGGRSSRMGENKALLPFRGKPLLQHILDVSRSISDRVMIIGQKNTYGKFDVPVFEDLLTDKGPAGGLLTGLHYSQAEINLLVACDYPLLENTLPEFLINSYIDEDVLVPEDEVNIHPLLSIYNKRIYGNLKSKINTNMLKMKSIIAGLKHRKIMIPNTYAGQLINVNTKEEYQKLIHANTD